ncbi:MAG: exonuclease SbcCD subunit D [Methanosarcinaceae archaeon]|nr:exonuclease SbcCD subunit D [Methanosarcinaceae archaeon]
MTREIRILHTADTHLGYRQYQSEVRRQDFFKAFEAVVRDAIDMQVDAVVHAGDLFDSRTPSLEDVLETVNIITPLKTTGIPLLGIVGNHESKQNMQWLDLFEEMGLAHRLGKKPYLLGEVALYGIDSVPKSKIPTYDYSGFESTEKLWKLLVMHQLMKPFPYGEWDCEELLKNLPFQADAILLGDYHKYEKRKVGETWVSYPGSTERNSAAEREARSYNIITLGSQGLEISRRNLETRKFIYINASLKNEERPYEQIFAAIDEYETELEDAVVFVEISGETERVLSFGEIEEYILNKGALVPRIKDLQEVDSLASKEELRVSFSDPDRAVAEEIKQMELTDGGLIIDEIVRNPLVSKTNVDSEAETQLKALMDKIDFKASEFQFESEFPCSSERVEAKSQAISAPEKGRIKEEGIEGIAEEEKKKRKAAVEKKKEAREKTPELIEKEMKAPEAEAPAKSENPKPSLARKKKKLRTPAHRQYNLGDYL